MTVEIAGLRLRFRSDPAALDVVDRRYGAFACETESDQPAVDVELDLSDVNAAGRTVVEPFRVSAEGDRVVLDGAGVYAVVERSRSRAWVRGPRSERPVDAVMRYLLAADLLERGGVLVHASTVVIGGRAWVFPGPSGAGKSTLAAELDGVVLCDEAIALLPHGDGVAAHATPYWTARPGWAPVAGIAFPTRGDAPSWQSLSSAQAVARLLPEIGPMLPEETPRALRIACRLVDSVPCAMLTLPTIEHISAWLQPRLDAPPPMDRKDGVVAP